MATILKADDIDTALRLLFAYDAMKNWTVTGPRYIEIHMGCSPSKAMRLYTAAAKIQRDTRRFQMGV